MDILSYKNTKILAVQLIQLIEDRKKIKIYLIREFIVN